MGVLRDHLFQSLLCCPKYLKLEVNNPQVTIGEFSVTLYMYPFLGLANLDSVYYFAGLH